MAIERFSLQTRPPLGWEQDRIGFREAVQALFYAKESLNKSGEIVKIRINKNTLGRVMKQQGLASLTYEGMKKRTKREK